MFYPIAKSTNIPLCHQVAAALRNVLRSQIWGGVLFSCSPQDSNKVCHISVGQKVREYLNFEEREKADRQACIVHVGTGKKF